MVDNARQLYLFKAQFIMLRIPSGHYTYVFLDNKVKNCLSLFV